MSNLESLTALCSKLRRTPRWVGGTAKPQHMAWLREQCRELTRDMDLIGTTDTSESLYGIRFYEMPGQIVDVWMFADEKVLRRYLDGKLSELALAYLAWAVKLSDDDTCKAQSHPST